MKYRIELEPIAKARARLRFVAGKGAVGHFLSYTPTKTKKAEDFIKLQAKSFGIEIYPKEIPLRLTATFYRCKSKWLPRKETMPFRKPDLDNFLKLLLDALNGVAFYDDSQITTIEVKKRWTHESQTASRKARQNGKVDTNSGYIEFEITEDVDD